MPQLSSLGERENMKGKEKVSMSRVHKTEVNNTGSQLLHKNTFHDRR